MCVCLFDHNLDWFLIASKASWHYITNFFSEQLID